MKIVVLTPLHHFHAPVVLRELCEARRQDQILVVSTPKLSSRKAALAQVRAVIQKSGFDYMISMVLASLWFRAQALKEMFLERKPITKREFLDLREVLRHYHLEHYPVRSVNDESSVELVARWKPDVILADLFNEIIKPALLEIPRCGTINIHTSPLPKYRGMAPNFWALVNGEKEFGTSIHLVTSEIDNGDIVCQKKVEIRDSDTVFSFYRRCSLEAARMLPEALERLEKGSELSQQDDGASSYYSRITAEAIRQLRRRGRRFF